MDFSYKHTYGKQLQNHTYHEHLHLGSLAPRAQQQQHRHSQQEHNYWHSPGSVHPPVTLACTAAAHSRVSRCKCNWHTATTHKHYNQHASSRRSNTWHMSYLRYSGDRGRTAGAVLPRPLETTQCVPMPLPRPVLRAVEV
jgi:hypothetical protein